MSAEILVRGIGAALLSGAIVWVVSLRENEELGYADRQRYLPYINGSILPLFLLSLFLLTAALFGIGHAAEMSFSIAFSIFTHISIYYTLLLLLLPFIRRHIRARSCAMLWMIPNYLYITQQKAMELPDPLMVIPVSGRLVQVLSGIWFLGFLVVLIRRIISHFIFRRRILRDAEPVNDPEALALWEEEIRRARLKKSKIRIMTSSAVITPLTVGLFRRGIRVVLPSRSFSREELVLIFRHEIIHIGREDAWSKFFQVFCTAMCWFNPLMWIAMRKSADDLELSCDETVLMDADDLTKRRYADLLLRTAGDERGFSTCLSASANALRYRLKNVVKPPGKHSGALLLGAVFFVLCMTCGYAALSYGGGTGAEMIYQSQDPSRYVPISIFLREASEDRGELRRLPSATFREGVCQDEGGLHDFLSSLKMTELTGNYSFSGSRRECCLIFGTPEGELGLCLYDRAVKLVPLHGGRRSAVYYYLPEGMDWEYFDTLVWVRDEIKN